MFLMTNFEAIKELSIDEMAKFLVDIQYDSSEPTEKEMLEWLMSEAEEDENEDDCPDYDDADLETGFNPYMGCYDFDC